MSEKPRVEKDPLGEKQVPGEALYGVQTARALENFKISRLRVHPALITAFAEIKRAAAEINVETGSLDPELGEAIARAAGEVVEGRWRDQFQLDVFQAGAGTSYNMNVNEVVANRALEILGSRRGDHERLSPNDHVNKSQSTNDVMPTAMRVACVRLLRDLTAALDRLADSFAAKSEELRDVRKAGRTHLHDAVEMSLGQEMGAWGHSVRRAADRLRATEPHLLEIHLGGSAIGTGLNVKPEYPKRAVERLSEITGLELKEAPDRIQSTQSLGDFVALSGALRGLTVELSKIANDLRLLNSGPHTGLFEIELPALQPGSSIMPGKVNPAVAEMLNMVCFHVIGHDVAIGMAGEAGQLELNVMMPYVAFALLEGLDVMANAARTFDESCVAQIKAHPDRCREFAERTVGKAAELNEKLGFLGAAKVAERAIDTGKSVPEVMEEEEVGKS
jgi:aspartate ammonia-lyase